jgi:hypothetical protein
MAGVSRIHFGGGRRRENAGALRGKGGDDGVVPDELTTYGVLFVSNAAKAGPSDDAAPRANEYFGRRSFRRR